MEQIKISKVSLTGGMFLKTSFTEVLPDNDERKHPNVSCTAPVHEDMRVAFNAFKSHLALICEEITNEQFIEGLPNEHDGTQSMEMELGELVPAIKVSKAKRGAKQLSIVPEKEEKWQDKFDILNVEFRNTNGIAGIVLTGQKMLSTGKWMGIGPTPLVKERDSDYKHLDILFEDAELLKYECEQYLLHHKYAPAPDPELPFGDGPAEGVDSLFSIKAASDFDNLDDIDAEV